MCVYVLGVCGCESIWWSDAVMIGIRREFDWANSREQRNGTKTNGDKQQNDSTEMCFFFFLRFHSKPKCESNRAMTACGSPYE